MQGRLSCRQERRSIRFQCLCCRGRTKSEFLFNILLIDRSVLRKRETDPNDGRYKKIVFTEKAEQIEAVLKSEIEESETILLQGVTKEERQEFLRIAEKMLQNLDTFHANTVKKNAGRKKQHGGRTDE